ncbi:MAG: hypothetical protein FJW61_06310, partial [Actinobacteria bacterium]|nr:hypothetical protein [Actinomycetota bacterium]
MVDYRVFIIIFSALISIFVFLSVFAASFKTDGFRALILRVQTNFGRVIAAGRNKKGSGMFKIMAGWNDELKVFFEQGEAVKIMGINIASVEGLLFARIIIAASFAVLFI